MNTTRCGCNGTTARERTTLAFLFVTVAACSGCVGPTYERLHRASSAPAAAAGQQAPFQCRFIGINEWDVLQMECTGRPDALARLAARGVHEAASQYGPRRVRAVLSLSSTPVPNFPDPKPVWKGPPPNGRFLALPPRATWVGNESDTHGGAGWRADVPAVNACDVGPGADAFGRRDPGRLVVDCYFFTGDEITRRSPVSLFQEAIHGDVSNPTLTVMLWADDDELLPLASQDRLQMPQIAAIVDPKERLVAQCNRREAAACAALGDSASDDKSKFLAYEVACLKGTDARVCKSASEIFLRTNLGVWAPDDMQAAGATLLRGCKAGLITACMAAARVLDNHASPNPALVAWAAACSANIVDGCIQEAIFDRGPAGLAAAKTACEAGNAGGCGLLGDKYAEGLGVATDAARAQELRNKACGGGWGPSCTKLGLYDKGCRAGDTDSCDVLCKRGDAATCENASESVRDARRAPKACASGDAAMCAIACANGSQQACIDRCAYWLLVDHTMDGPPPSPDPCAGQRRTTVAPRMIQLTMKELAMECAQYKKTRDQNALGGVISMLQAGKTNWSAADVLAVNRAINECIRSK